MNPSLREMRDELSVGEEFVNRYNKPGPRYTSYPTAPVWTDSFGPKEYEQALAAAEAKRSPVSLYMHLPFCESLCLFCACNVIIQKDKRVAPPYLDVLKKETDHISHSVSRERQVAQFHWGGGTPTYLSPEQIEDLFTYTRERFTFAPDAEIGIEVDPRVTTRAHLETVRKLGFNRLSMGIQDFKPEVQKAVHRIQPYEQTRDLIAIARELGFDSINVDLIYGLPYQTAESFAHTVEQIVGLSPDRIAMFSYAHVPWLKKQQGSFVAHLPEGMQKFEIFRSGLLAFVEAGYLYIGMDHFAKADDELAVSQRNRTLHRNFQGYTTKAGADLYGMGITAISGIQDCYAQNYRDIPSLLRHAAQPHHRRREIDVRHGGIDPAAGGNQLGCANQQRHAERFLVHAALLEDAVAAHLLAVVAGHDHDRVVGQPERIQPAEEPPDQLVQQGDVAPVDGRRPPPRLPGSAVGVGRPMPDRAGLE